MPGVVPSPAARRERDADDDIDDEDHPGGDEDEEDDRGGPLRPIGPQHEDRVGHDERHAEQREGAPGHVDVARAAMRRRVALRLPPEVHRVVSGRTTRSPFATR